MDKAVAQVIQYKGMRFSLFHQYYKITAAFRIVTLKVILIYLYIWDLKWDYTRFF